MAIQGSSLNLQGSMPSLQGNALSLQGSSPTLQAPTVTQPVAPKPTQVAAIKPQQIDLSSIYGLNNGTVYNKTNNTAFSNAQDFFTESGQKTFDNLKFDTLYKPEANTPIYGQTTQQNNATYVAQNPNVFGTPPPAATPPQVTPPPPQPTSNDTYNSQIKALQELILKGYSPTDEETTLNKQYADLGTKYGELNSELLSAQSAAKGLEGQGRGIPRQLVTGQQGKLLEQADLDSQAKAALLGGTSQTLQQQLASLQSQRASTQEKLKTQLGFLQSEKPTELSAGSSLVKYNPQTGQYETVATGPEKTATENLPTSYQEYSLAVQQGYKGDYNTWLTEDANRKRSVTNVNAGGLTPYQENQTFLGISNKYQADQIINQAINGQTASSLADQIIANPKAATSQLTSLYLLVKNLDPNSAVREGELALAQQTQSYLQRFSNALTSITEGRILDPQTAVDLAKATKELAGAWSATAQRRQKQYSAQANTAGVGDQFNNYLGGYQSGFSGAGGTPSNANINDLF